MKKILTILFLFIRVLSYGQLDTIDIGTAPNNGTGESLRSGMIKVNIAIRQLDIAYADRFKWDGGATGLVAGTGRSSLGATTVGAAFFMLTNPGAISFVRINADNSLSALSDINFRTAIGTLAKADSGVWAGGYVSPADLDAAVLGLTDTVALETIVTLQSDTVPLATFGLGSGRIGDTAFFQDNVLIGSFYNKGSDSLIITSLKCYLYAGSGTESVVVNIAWSDTIMAVVPVKLNTSGYTATNHVVGMEDTSFNNATIPPNKLVYGWITGNSAGNKPSYLSVTLSGHKINRSY
jgi:hypothetical protein